MSHSFTKDFTSGGQLTMHAIRMFGQAARSIVFFSLIIFIGLWLILFFLKTDPYDRYLMLESISAYLKGVLQGRKATHLVQDMAGQWVQVSATHFMDYPQTISSLRHCIVGLVSAFYGALIGCCVSLGGVGIWFYVRGRQQRGRQELNGQLRVKPAVLRKRLTQAKKASDFTVAGVPLLKDSEVQHILLMGTTGTGKSVCLGELMDQVRAQKQRAIVFDIEGAFIPHYYRRGKDVILNPMDERCPSWNIWQEGNKASDFESMASSLMPLHLAGTDPFWIHSARTIFSCAAQRLQQDNKKTMLNLLKPLFSEELGSLSALLRQSPAESLVSDKNEKTALSIKATLSTYCKSLLYLKDDPKSLFSIRRWIESDTEDSWLFVGSNAQKIDALKPLISVWLDVAAKAVLSLEPSQYRRLWFFLDELPSLHRLPSFMNTLERGRKYGACFVAAIQDIHQLRSIYGRDEAETLISLFNTNLCYRSKCPDSAAWMSKVMGSLELLENREGYSYGAHEMRDGVSIQQERRREPVVKESEFSELNDLEAFLRLPGDWPVTYLKFNPQKRPIIADAFIEREGTELLLLDVVNPSELSVHSTSTQQSIPLQTVDATHSKPVKVPETVPSKALEGALKIKTPKDKRNKKDQSVGQLNGFKETVVQGSTTPITEVQWRDD